MESQNTSSHHLLPSGFPAATFPAQFAGEYIAGLIVAQIEEMCAEKIISLTADHASNMKKAFQLVEERFPWVICVGCKAHCLHLVCTDIADLPEISPLIEICKETVKFFCHKTPRALLPEAQMYHYARKAHLALPSNVRWGTIHAMIESILNSTEAIKQVLRDARVSENRDLSVDAKDQLTFYETGENVQKLKEVELLLRPASLTIKKIESDTLNSTKAYFEAIQAMDEVAVQADHIIYLEVEVKEKIKQIAEDRKKFAYSPVFHLVRMLDPYDQGRSFTNQQKIEATQVLTKLMKHPDLIPNQAQAMTEWAQWKPEAGINTNPNNVTSPLLMSTLQQLSGLSGTAATGFLPPSTKLPLANQFPADLTNVQWNAQQAWLDPTKMAAMLPMYGVLSGAVVGDPQLGGLMEQNLTNQAVAAAAAVCTPTTLEAFRLAQAGVDQISGYDQAVLLKQTEPETMGQPIDIQVAVTSSPVRRANSRLQSTPKPASIASSPMTSSAGHMTPQSGHFSGNISHPASNEIMHVDSPMDHHHRNLSSAHSSQFSPNSPIKHPQVVPPQTSLSQTLPESYPSSSTQIHKEQAPASSTQADAFRPFIRKASKAGTDLQAFGTQPSTSKETNAIDDFSMLELEDFEAFMGKDALNELASLEKDSQNPFMQVHKNDNQKPSTSRKGQEDLAHVDKELDRLVSLAARNDSRKPTFLPAPFDPFGYLKKTSNSAASSSDPATLKPVNFTPPESPTHSNNDTAAAPPTIIGMTQPTTPSRPSASSTPFANFMPGSSTASTSKAIQSPMNKQMTQSLSKTPNRPALSQTPAARIFSDRRPSATLQRPAPSSSVQPLLFIPQRPKTSASQKGGSKLPVYKQSANKVPVYKQKASVILTPTIEKKTEEKKTEDAFSFTDDEEEESLTSIAKAPVQNLITQSNKTDDEAGKRLSGPEADIKIEPRRQSMPDAPVSMIVHEMAIPVFKPPPMRSVVAEQIRNRHKLLHGESFVQSECTDDVEAAMTSVPNEQQPMLMPSSILPKAQTPARMEIDDIPTAQSIDIKKELSPTPSKTSNEDTRSVHEEGKLIIPKLVIKLKRDTIDEPPKEEPHTAKEKHKKKKKRKHKEKDHEWEGSDHYKKKKKHKHKKEHKRKESHGSYEAHVMSMSDEEEYHRKRHLDTSYEDDLASTSRTGNLEAFVNSRLSQFGQAHGDLPKGTFVVAKCDIFRPDCALWRVDNQNLLQKFPPVTDWVTINPCYRNSSTYSGWCDQIADGYLTVGIKYHKQSRIETIVEPEVPIADLFPAITEEIPVQNTYENDVDDGHTHETMNKDVLRSHMKTFVNALLQHTISLNFLQTIRQGNDYNYLCALNEVEKMNVSGKQKVKEKVKWNERFANEIKKYVDYIAFDINFSEELCQACGTKKITKVAQFFNRLDYNYDTLEILKSHENGAGSPLQAMEFLICSLCAHLASTYHKLHHMRFIVFRKCEDKIEALSTEKPELSLEALVQLCMTKKAWQNQVVNEYVEIWKRIQMNDL